jgi:hypothetical protein
MESLFTPVGLVVKAVDKSLAAKRPMLRYPVNF